MEALLAAYRTGARRAWRLLSDRAVTAGLRADQVAAFAELVFAYIDELSAARARPAMPTSWRRRGACGSGCWSGWPVSW